MPSSHRILTVGHAIVDVLAPSGDDLVERFGLQKGTMTLVEGDRAEEIYEALGPATEVSGGSAANTAAALASLGADVEFVGKIRDDALGTVFSHDIRASGVRFEAKPSATGPGTGRCLIMVTPDAEKTMCTSLGIGATLAAGDIEEAAVAGAGIAYIEGYLYGGRDTDPAVERLLDLAEKSGTKVALSLSDPVWVEMNGAHFERILDRVDILFANEDEAVGMAGTGTDVEAALASLAKRCDVVAVTLGARGSIVAHAGEVAEAPAAPVDTVVDTTGAGDSYAAGFLFGLVNGHSPLRCAELGALVASEVVSHIGARPLTSLSELAKFAGLI